MFKKAVRRAAIWAAVILFAFFVIKQIPARNQVALVAYQNGEYETAFKLWRKMARNGDSTAQYNIGALYAAGKGVAVSSDEAQKWFLLSAENGNAAAQFEIGKIYENAKVATTSLPKALVWIRRSAEQGYGPAQLDLGLKYLAGNGVDQDADKATLWLSRVLGEGREPPVLSTGGSAAGFPVPSGPANGKTNLK